MFSAAVNRLDELHGKVAPELIEVLRDILGNATQPLEHSGQVTLNRRNATGIVGIPGEYALEIPSGSDAHFAGRSLGVLRWAKCMAPSRAILEPKTGLSVNWVSAQQFESYRCERVSGPPIDVYLGEGLAEANDVIAYSLDEVGIPVHIGGIAGVGAGVGAGDGDGEEPIVGRATTIKCTTNGVVAYTDTDITVDGVVTIAPAGAPAPTVTSVKNFSRNPAADNTDLIAHKVGSEWWAILPNPWETLTAVTDVAYNGSTKTLEEKTTTALVVDKGEESDATPIIAFTPITLVNDVSYNEGVVNETTTVCWVVDTGGVAVTPVLTFEQVTIVTDVTYDDDKTINETTVTGWVVDKSGESTAPIITFVTSSPISSVTYDADNRKIKTKTRELVVVSEGAEVPESTVIEFVVASNIMTNFEVAGLQLNMAQSEFVVVSDEDNVRERMVHTGTECPEEEE